MDPKGRGRGRGRTKLGNMRVPDKASLDRVNQEKGRRRLRFVAAQCVYVTSINRTSSIEAVVCVYSCFWAQGSKVNILLQHWLPPLSQGHFPLPHLSRWLIHLPHLPIPHPSRWLTCLTKDLLVQGHRNKVCQKVIGGV